MGTVAAHYAEVLADVYSWMLGGFDAALERNRAFFAAHGIRPSGLGQAIDLGAGCGFQSIPLAELGFSVTSIDLDRTLLDELDRHAGELQIVTVQDDLLNFPARAAGPFALAVCMVDTLLHLESSEHVRGLFATVADRLEDAGRFVLTFRDLSQESHELDRFIPVRADDDTIMTCFLEYETETVKVHDLVYRRIGDQWHLRKSFYRKLRLAKGWVEDELSRAGFSALDSTIDKGLVTIIAEK